MSVAIVKPNARSWKMRTTALLVTTALVSTGCNLTKQEVGTVIGTVAGVAVGSFFGSGAGQVVATVLGGAIGGLIGNQIGKYLDDADKAAVAEAQAQLLRSGEEGDTVFYENPDTGVSARTYVEQTEMTAQNASFIKPRQVVIPAGMELIGRDYRVEASSLNLRAGPGTRFAKIGNYPQGSVFNAVGRVPGTDWVLISQGNVSLGYMKTNNGRFLAEVPFNEIAAANGANTSNRGTNELVDVGTTQFLGQLADKRAQALVEGKKDEGAAIASEMNRLQRGMGLVGTQAPVRSPCKTVVVEVTRADSDAVDGKQTNRFCQQADGTYDQIDS